MANRRCYYEILEIEKGVDDEKIKLSFRKLAMQWHPDRNAGNPDAEARFREVNEAYEVLRDQDKRKRYDRYGFPGIEASETADRSGGQGSIFDIFNDLFGGSGGRQQRNSGEDLQIETLIDLAEAAKGITRKIKVPRSESCGDCSGSGCKPGSKKTKCRKCDGQGAVLQGQGFFRIQRACPACGGAGQTIADPCKNCAGKGTRPFQQEVEVKIPPGVDDGVTLRLTGYGEAGPARGAPGDLYVLIRVRKHPFYQRNGTDLICEVPFSFAQAALGDSLELPCIIGDPVKLEIPAGLQSMEVLRVPGRGMPNLRGGRPGDLLVQMRLETPRKLTTKQQELFKELKDLEDNHPQSQTKSFFDKIRNFFAGSADSTKAE
ncbi:MAG: molecular chaperone DnaJ [Gemmataceae bacterium]